MSSFLSLPQSLKTVSLVLTGNNFYGATAADVREQLLKARSDHSRGLPVIVERQTVGQFLGHWLEHTLKPTAKPRSYESFTTIMRLHIKSVLGKIQLHKLAPQHVQKLLDEKSKSGLSPQRLRIFAPCYAARLVRL
jgi:hypothetical protein